RICYMRYRESRDGLDSHRDVHVVMAALDVVEALPIEEDQRLAEAAAANGEIGLDAIRRALAYVERGVELERVDEGVKYEILGSHGEDANRAIDFFERKRLERGGDDDGFVFRRRRSLG